MKSVAVIPARGGSKRIPRKNIREFCGKPIIGYSIEAAIESGCFTQVVVSTDDKEIADIARSYGAITPFERPSHLADDHATTIDVLAHSVDALSLEGDDLLTCIYATAPFVREEWLSSAISKIKSEQLDYVVSVCEFGFPIGRALGLRAGKVQMLEPENMNLRSQDLVPAYHDAGQFYICSVGAIRKRKDFFVGAKCGAYILPTYMVQDIDQPDDWIRAEAMYRALNEKE